MRYSTITLLHCLLKYNVHARSGYIAHISFEFSRYMSAMKLMVRSHDKRYWYPRVLMHYNIGC